MTRRIRSPTGQDPPIPIPSAVQGASSPPVHRPCEALRGRQAPRPPADALWVGMTAVRLHSDLFCSIPGGIICFVLESKRLLAALPFYLRGSRPGRGGCFALGRAWSPLRAEPVPPRVLTLTRPCAATSRDPPSPPLQMAPERSWSRPWLSQERASAAWLPRACSYTVTALLGSGCLLVA